jgi:biotin transport system permease protein
VTGAFRREALFVYTFLDSPLHRADARTKLASLALLATATIASSWFGLATVAAAACAAIIVSRIPPRRIARESAGVLPLVALIAAGSILGAPTLREGFVTGARSSLRFILLFALAEAFVSTTTVADIRRGVSRLLRFAPARVAWALSSMVALSVAFIPLPLEVASAVRLAALARGLSPRRRPLCYAKLLAFELVVRTLIAAETRSYALACRGGDPDRRIEPKRFAPVDLAVASLALVTFAAAAAR